MQERKQKNFCDDNMRMSIVISQISGWRQDRYRPWSCLIIALADSPLFARLYGFELEQTFFEEGETSLSSWEGGVFARVQAFNVKLLKIKRRDLIYIRVFLPPPPLPYLTCLVGAGTLARTETEREKKRKRCLCSGVWKKSHLFPFNYSVRPPSS